ncbi:hypothetical protein [Streptomyces clavuligerus]|uniref:hypothetical protein n=1 Tax=Streptomyces clavuligerus TaxID=1901 RepID=UPI0001851F1F|nr:hypothetical protein [Streptomyces clavuligerus]WDN57502.1 hypothetical protein LL058_37715 [Streptomyces clavuligerus]
MVLRALRRPLAVPAVLACSAALLGASGAATVAEADAPVVVITDWSAAKTAITATCPQGTQLVGGGYDSEPVHLGNGAVADAVNTNAPSASKPNSWVIKMDLGRAKAIAMCSKASATPPTIVTSAWSAAKQAVYATCPARTQLTGGGYDSQPVHTGNGANADTVATNGPSAAKPNSWVVRMDLGKIQSFAMCVPD